MARRNGGLKTVKAVRQDLAQLRTDVNSLIGRFGRAGLGLDGDGHIGDMRRNAVRAYSRFSRRAQRYGRSVGRTVNAYPVQSVAIAAVAGAMVIGAVIGRIMTRED